jgi:EmrB/QacA subfamily drug resistance transporter
VSSSPSPHAWRVFGIASLATFLAFLDTTIVNVAFPDLLGDFPGAGLDTLAWVINGYALLFAALLAVSGRTADLVGRKRVFLGGVALFVLGSSAAGLAPSAGALIAARLVQGAAAAAMVPSALALLLPEFPPARRASVVGLWGGVAGIAAALGPVLGGILVDVAGWRLVFVVNVPVGLAALALGLRMLPESRAEGESVRPDIAGAALLAGATALVALGLLQANSWGWADPRTLGAWALAVMLAAALGARSRRHPAPIVETALWRVRSFAVANGAQFVFGAAFLAAPLVGALLLTGVWGYSTLEAGLAIAPGPLAAAVMAVLAGRIADRTGQRAVVVPGTIVYAAGLAWQALALSAEPDLLGAWLPGQVLAGAGVGLVLPALTSAAARSLPPQRFATGMAMSLTSRQLGIVLGIAVVVAVIGTPAPGDALDAYRSGLGLCAIVGLLAGVVALGLGSGPRTATVRAARPAEATS